MTRAVFLLAMVALLAALAWGVSVGREPVPARPQDLTKPVTSDWYEQLPTDPAAATQAYLDRIPSDMRARGESYSDSRLLAFVFRVLTLLLATALITMSGMGARMRELATRVSAKPIVIDALVALQYFVVLYALSLPAEVYAGFVRPHRFGFSDQPFIGWWSDDLINWGILTLFYAIGVLLIYRFIRRRQAAWVLYAIGTYVVLRALYALLGPNVIEPMTNDFRPFPQGEPRQQILALAQANGIAAPEIVVSDASRQSRLLNAHVSGLGATARISVDDTTLSTVNTPTLRLVLAHEIGHYVLNHDAQFVVTDTLTAGTGFALIALVFGTLVRRFGGRWRMQGIADIASVPLFWGLFLLWGYASLPISNAIARNYEHQADLYGLNASQAPHGMAEFMIHDADTARLQPTALERALFYTHPSDVDRIMTAMQWRAAQSAPH